MMELLLLRSVESWLMGCVTERGACMQVSLGKLLPPRGDGWMRIVFMGVVVYLEAVVNGAVVTSAQKSRRCDAARPGIGRP